MNINVQLRVIRSWGAIWLKRKRDVGYGGDKDPTVVIYLRVW
jgi:hypothetical protein